MTADLPVQDLIAGVQREHAWAAAFGGCSGGCEWVANPQDDTEQDQHAAHVAAAVVAAIQGATVAQQRDLLGGDVERLAGYAVSAERGEEIVARARGPWREDPA